MSKINNLINKVFGEIKSVTPSVINNDKVSGDELRILKKFGVDSNTIQDRVLESLQINYERTNVYREIDRSLNHWMMGAAAELYADSATPFSTVNNGRIWVQADNKYNVVLNKFLFDIGIEEKLFDWAWSIGSQGDLFVEPNGVPGLGIISVDDNYHPSSISRIDYNGVLLGFFQTPGGHVDNATKELLSPWSYVHFRLLGAKKRRPVFEDNSFQEYKTINLMGPETKQISTKYGTSLLVNGLPIYKRLRLAEDSILMARLTRGILKYIYKIKVDPKQTVDAAISMTGMYKEILKHARATNLTDGQESFDSKSNPLSNMEDLFVPVFGEVGDISIDKVGGECLRGDTRIRLLDGTTPTIKEMSDNPDSYIGKDVYACTKDGEVVGRRINNVLMTRPQTNFVRVHLDNGKHFDVTPDHPCMLRTGEFRHAELLQPGESLMPLYTNKNREGYERVYHPKDGLYHFTHTLVAKDTFKKQYKQKYAKLIETGLEEYLVVHHKDFVKENNDSSNLEWMGCGEHVRYHSQLKKGRTLEEMCGKKKAKAIKKIMSETSTKYNNKRWSKLSKEERRTWVNENVISKRKPVKHKEDCTCCWCEAARGSLDRFGSTIDITCEYGEKFKGVSFSTYCNHRLWHCPNTSRPIRKPVSEETKKKISKQAKGRLWVYDPVEKKEHLVFPEDFGFCIDMGWQAGRPSQKAKYMNHKVTKVEKLDIIEDAYDIVIEDARDKNGGPEHCFALEAGVFVHNTDIRWIADIQELRNQLACALRTPLALLGGFVEESSGALGASSIEKQDIRFARNSRRLQRSIINGVTRLCQIHLALLGMDPDPALFEVQMAENCTAEEVELKESLESSISVVRDVMDVFEQANPNVDKVKLLAYLNDKLLKLSDVDIQMFFNSELNIKDMMDNVQEKKKQKRHVNDMDVYSYLPIHEKVNSKIKKAQDWECLFEDCDPDDKKKVQIITEKKKK